MVDLPADDDFAALFEATTPRGQAARKKRLSAGDAVSGVVVKIADDTVFLDIGEKAEGRIDRRELQGKDGALRVAVGDPLRATVRRMGPSGAELVVALGRHGADTGALQLARDTGTPIEGTVSKAVKAGLEVDIGGVRAFCPASQVEAGYAGDLEAYVGQTHFFKVIELREGGRSAIVSRRAVLEAQRAEQAGELLRRLSEGAELEGIVQSVKPYGAFVDLGGLQGLVHVSELAHGRVTRPEEVVDVGEKVRVKVLRIEPGASGQPSDAKVSLSMRALEQPTRDDGANVDEVISATVRSFESYGVTVDTAAGRGVISNDELGIPRGADPRKAFEVGATIEVVVLGRGSGKLRLSARGVDDARARSDYREFTKRGGAGRAGGLGSFADLLANAALQLPDGPRATQAASGASAAGGPRGAAVSGGAGGGRPARGSTPASPLPASREGVRARASGERSGEADRTSAAAPGRERSAGATPADARARERGPGSAPGTRRGGRPG